MTVQHKTENAYKTLDEMRETKVISETHYYLIYNMFFNIGQQHEEELAKLKQEIIRLKKTQLQKGA